MTKGVKIAIGCVAALALAVIIAAVALGGLAYWAKGKAEGFAGDMKKYAALEEAANRPTFTQPSDGVIPEARLLTFLEIRKRVFAVYELHRADIETLGKKDKGDLSDVTRGLGLLKEIRTAQLQAQVDEGMGTAEYHFIVGAVYRSAWADEWSKGSNATSPSEAMHKASEEAREAMRHSAKEAREHGVEVPDMHDAEEALEHAEESAKNLDVPPENLALFRKYEAEIKKYAMHGMEAFGL